MIKRIVILGLLLTFSSALPLFAETPVCSLKEVNKIELHMSHENGKFQGYVIFYAQNKPCSVMEDNSGQPAKLIAQEYNFSQDFLIKLSDFRDISIVANDEMRYAWGYKIPPFELKTPSGKPVNAANTNQVVFTFTCGPLETSDKARVGNVW